MRYRSVLLLLVVLMGQLALRMQPVQAVQPDSERAVQALFGQTTPDKPKPFFDLLGMKAGQTIYLYSESDQFDTYLVLCNLACDEKFAENDDIETGVNTNSAIQYTFEADGDYSIAVSDYGTFNDDQESQQG